MDEGWKGVGIGQARLIRPSHVRWRMSVQGCRSWLCAFCRTRKEGGVSRTKKVSGIRGFELLLVLVNLPRQLLKCVRPEPQVLENLLCVRH